MKALSLAFSTILVLSRAAVAETMFYASTTDQFDGTPGQILKVDSSGAVTPWNINWAGGVTLEDPQGMAWDSHGNLFINDGANIYKVDPGGNGSIFATKPNFYDAYGLAIDANDNVYAVGNVYPYYAIYRYDSSGAQTGVFQTYNSYVDLVMGPGGKLYASDLFSGAVYSFDLDENLSRHDYVTGIASAYSMTFDSSGNLYVVGATSLNRIYKVSPGGVKTTFVNSGLYQGGGIVAANGNLYVGNFTSSWHNEIRYRMLSGGTSGVSKLTVTPALTDAQHINFMLAAFTSIPEPDAWGVVLGFALIAPVIFRLTSPKVAAWRSRPVNGRGGGGGR